jgi:hypothetical protein
MGSLKLVTTGEKPIKVGKQQIIFDVEGDTFKIRIGQDLDLEEVYTVLLSAAAHLEDLALGILAHPESQELH